MSDAAYKPKPQNDLVRPVAFCTLIVVAAWNLAGWLMSEGPIAYRMFMAAITVAFEVLCFNVSAQKARADARKVTANVRRYWFWALIMCCGWSVFCAHNALMLFTPDMGNLQRAPAYAVLTLAAFIVPLMPWAIERTEEAPKRTEEREPGDARAGEQRDQHASGRPSDGDAADEQSQATANDAPDKSRATGGNRGRPILREVGKAFVGAAGVQAGAQAIEPPSDGPQLAPVVGAHEGAWRAQVRAMWVGGERNKSKIARAVGRPRETVRRELRALGA